ncbi:uncharacterized protein LOC129599686 [Paramacrobiotus metropolitanus]|uniref:uncharacterized protein LOC129599686 n=1 Tax=Paramacrobiotus metropolitanus TaxID=2943436 RepID=UPI002445AEF9|nr:uncharacterized protein LOC129599686 [Paramacrobiotus metropolitanus]
MLIITSRLLLVAVVIALLEVFGGHCAPVLDLISKKDAFSDDAVQQKEALAAMLGDDGNQAELISDRSLLQSILSQMRGTGSAADGSGISSLTSGLNGGGNLWGGDPTLDLGLGRAGSGKWIARYTAALHDSLSPSGPG